MALDRPILPSPDVKPIGTTRRVDLTTEQVPRQILMEYDADGNLSHVVGHFQRAAKEAGGAMVGGPVAMSVRVETASLSPATLTAIGAVLSAIEPQ